MGSLYVSCFFILHNKNIQNVEKPNNHVVLILYIKFPSLSCITSYQLPNEHEQDLVRVCLLRNICVHANEILCSCSFVKEMSVFVC
ncbi:hypothetical protein HanRHA438_Chr06g0286751 [Helianthus annuus]|nr:hypothetical protein HanRHA438_Chr06g0286751 [Helianthus annuus]